jgi:hypothetical protein
VLKVDQATILQLRHDQRDKRRSRSARWSFHAVPLLAECSVCPAGKARSLNHRLAASAAAEHSQWQQDHFGTLNALPAAPSC